MLRRRLIRTLLLLPVLLCLAGWGWGSSHDCWVTYDHDGRWVAADAATGIITVFVGWDSPKPNGGAYKIERIASGQFWPKYAPGFHSLLGFSVGRAAGWGGKFYFLNVPFWFLIVLFSALFLLIYRQTRPNPHPRTAFPIEPAAPRKRT
jgi:hypothetical protein